jgi:glycosyltransferase involved in cell wall biosynthesis
MDGLKAKMKKKILFMVQVPPPVHGAALRNLSLYESKLLQETFAIRLARLAFADSIYDIGRFSLKKVFKTVSYAVKLISVLASFRPDIAYFTLTPAGGAFYRDCLFVLILKLTNVKIVYHLRGIGINKAKNKNRLNRILYNFVFKNTNVVCLAPKQLEDIRGLKYKKYFIVPNGIKIEANTTLANRINSGTTRLLFLSNFVKSKGVFEFLEACRQIKAKQIKFEALLVGADYDVTRAEIESYIKAQGLEECVKVVGPAYKQEKFQLISDSDIFVFPTYYPFELFPGVILEAMQCGKPVISTYHGVIENIIDDGETGFLVHTGNVAEIVGKIEYLVMHSDRSVLMGMNGKRKFFEQYTLEKFESNMKSVFEEV